MYYAISAFFLWGLFPLFFRLFSHIPSLDVLLFRLLWTFVFVAIVVVVRGQWQWLGNAMKSRKVLLSFFGSSLMITINWTVFQWGVSNDRVMEVSLGNFIAPLVAVFFGCIALRERLRTSQSIAIAMAAAGVLWMTAMATSIPWTGIIIGLSFGTYSLLRKIASLEAIEGLMLEMILMMPLVMLGFAWRMQGDSSVFAYLDWQDHLLLMLSGPVTAIPIMWFTKGARLMPLSVLGLLQYISPTMQFLLGVLVFSEAFDLPRVVGFGLIWGGLIVFSVANLLRRWHKP